MEKNNVYQKLKSYDNYLKKRKYNYAYTIISIILIYVILNLTMINDGIFSYKQSIYITVMIYIIFSLSLNIVVGVMGELNLGHAAFISIGAYTGSSISKILISNNINTNLILIITCIIGGIIAGLFSIIVSYVSTRLRGDYLAIITLAFGEIIKYVIQNISFLGGAAGLKNIPSILNFTNVYIISILCIVIMIMILISRFGRFMLTIRENEIAAENIGVNVSKIKIIAFYISAFFAGVGGVIYAHYLGVIKPDQFNFVFSIEILVIVVFGGLGSITGAISSAVFITLVNESLRRFSEYRILIYALILILLMIYSPNGLLGTREFTFNNMFKSFKKFRKVSFKKKDESEETL